MNILRIISLSQKTIRYPCLKPEIVLQALKDSYTWNMKVFQKIAKFKIYLNTTKTGVCGSCVGLI